jgi:glycosyltransferase involved in cell wall biosynthesis
MPAYFAAQTIERTVADLPRDLIDEIILVDNASRDETVAVAKRLGLTVYVHESNRGYGGSQKTCYAEALKRDPDIVVMVHSDYQYDPNLLGVLCEPIVNGRVDIMLGSRIQNRRQALRAGMPIWKYFSNRFLTIVENIAAGTTLSEFHTGYRAFSARSLRMLPVKRYSDDYVFDQQILLSAMTYGLNIGDTPVPCRYFPEASSVDFRNSVRYGLGTLWAVLIFSLSQSGLIRSRMFKRRRRQNRLSPV